MSLTDSYYTFMVDDKMQDGEGNEIERMSGDDLFEAAKEKTLTLNQKVLGFAPDKAGDAKRKVVNAYAQKEISINNAGLQFSGMTIDSGEMNKWIEDVGGAQNLTVSGVGLPDIATNTPLRIIFGSSKDMSGKLDKVATISDPTVLQEGGWAYKLLDQHFDSKDKVANELYRQQYNAEGYENITMDRYTSDMAEKTLYYYGGATEEDFLAIKRDIEDKSIKSLLSNIEFGQFNNYTNPTTGVRGVNGQTGFINFTDENGVFNMAAWETLKDRPAELASIRKTMLETSLKQFGGTDF